MPGVTRDRVTAEAEWRGRPFTLVDTGGIGLVRGEKVEDVIITAALEQVELAIAAADCIIFVVNVQEGVVPLDREVAQRLHASGKPVIVAINKVDTYRAERGAAEFAELGFAKLLPVTAIHGRGIEDLMEAAKGYLPEDDVVETEAAAEDAEPADAPEADSPAPRSLGPLKLAIVGRPNVGKSSIINALTHSERVVVSPIPGTTRDAVDVPFEVETEGVRQKYVLIDTAGLRKARRVDDTVEYFSVQRTEEAIRRADIVVLVIDAESGVVEQDKKIADLITEARRACILVINKWDLLDDSVRNAREEELERRKREGRYHREGQPGRPLITLAEFGKWVQEKLFFLDYAPVIFTSAKSGFQLDRLLESVRYVAAQLRQQVPTAILNRTLTDAIQRRQPISAQGHHLKFFYATQVRQSPPTFLLFVNRGELFSPQYQKYLAGELRTAFGYEGCPLLLVAKARPKTIEPVRKFKPRSTEEPKAPLSKPSGPPGRSKRPAARPPGRPPGPPPARPKFPSNARFQKGKPKPSGLPTKRRSGKARAARRLHGTR
jgi:GTP-binding protein